MSEWSHPICDECWDDVNPDRAPVRLTEPEPERCCWCGDMTYSGIYVREDPKALPNHHVHEESV